MAHPNSISRMLDNTLANERGCFLWQGGLADKRYGKTSYLDQTWTAHRLMWFLHFGEIPKDKVIMHLCDTPRCIRIDHLRLGTNAENVADMHIKKRGYGSRKIQCKRGHPFNEENTYYRPNGVRNCRICTRKKLSSNKA